MTNPILTHLSRVIEICEKASPNWVADLDETGQSNWINAIVLDNGSTAHIFADGISPLAPKYKRQNVEFAVHARTCLPQLAKALQWQVEFLSRNCECIAGQYECHYCYATEQISALLGLAGEGKYIP